ncbi:MAG: D-tyrosyl-tRNA(Tyr) deacylase [Bacteroidales bacterium]|jgi:D-tyrosyl-tRNA(Tyr) deacylase|nr:D-tyrosyl-tRNA(Tyr) deacylase [Bacteroidales bacterium]
MRAIIQRVSHASVEIEMQKISEIGFGLLIFLSVEAADTQDDIVWLAQKIANMRIFDDENGVMNLSIIDKKAEMLIVSNFTLHASTKKGNRPTYIRAAGRAISLPMYEQFVKYIKETYSLQVKTGEFGADMQVQLTNSGPVTIIIDSKIKE